MECGLPCENDMCKMYKLSDDEREILEYRFEFPMVYLCDSHYHDPGVPGGGARHFSRHSNAGAALQTGNSMSKV